MVRKSPPISVESAYQGSKVFEQGGPYQDLYDKKSLEAKKDNRIRNSGDLVAFDLKGRKWPIEPKNAFYDWLYLRSLNQYKGKIEKLLNYDGFTDIEFNPDKSFNCQARAVAMAVALHQAGCLEEAIRSKESFIHTLNHGIPQKGDMDMRVNGTPDLFSSSGAESPKFGGSYISSDVIDSLRESVRNADSYRSAKKKASHLLLVEILRKLRVEAGLTQKEVGEELRVSRSTISSFERGQSNPQLGLIIGYMDVIGADLGLAIHVGGRSIPVRFLQITESDEGAWS
jgi:DNA-binding XRE family transcriptional regulator